MDFAHPTQRAFSNKHHIALAATMLAAIVALLVFVGLVTSATPYDDYILAPSSRTVHPASIHRVNGSVSNAQSLVTSTNGSAILRDNSSITLDYGKNVGGLVSITVGAVASTDAVVGVTFTESSLWINGAASDATADAGLDTPLWITVGEGPGTYTVAREFDRGAFRYLSVVSNSTGAVEIQNVAVEFTAAPTQDLRMYTGYFHSDDELLNRIWYAGECCEENMQVEIAGRDNRLTIHIYI